MTRHTLLAAAAVLALSGPAFAQNTTVPSTSGPPPVVYVPPAPGTVITPPQPAPQAPVVTMQQPAPRGNTRSGQLQCDVSAGVGYVFGSTRDLTCEFKPVNAPVERYVGEIRRFGVDVGVTGRGTFLWEVFNTGSDVRPGSLSGTYVGASSNVAAGLGLGTAALIGGSNDQVALQPLAIEAGTGLNVAAGIAEIRLRPAG